MAVTIISRDNVDYLALPVHSTAYDGSDGFDVLIIPVTLDTLAEWQTKFELADRLKAEHDISFIGFDADFSSEWRAADSDTDPIDVDGEIQPPDWTTDPQRTECDIVEVSPQHLEWTAMPKHTGDHVNATLWRDDLPALIEALKEKK